MQSLDWRWSVEFLNFNIDEHYQLSGEVSSVLNYVKLSNFGRFTYHGQINGSLPTKLTVVEDFEDKHTIQVETTCSNTRLAVV